MYKRILVATDGSTLSKKAVTSAIELAATCGAELVAIKVVPRYPQAYFEGSIPLSSDEISRVESQWTEAAQVQLAAVEKSAKAKAVSAKTITVKSDVVSDAIIAAAKKHKADLIVMASHGRKGACCWAAKPSRSSPTPTFPCWCCDELTRHRTGCPILHLAHGVARQFGHHKAALGDFEIGQFGLELSQHRIGLHSWR
jgi:nucleotide-binding universal stress UspA family protein